MRGPLFFLHAAKELVRFADNFANYLSASSLNSKMMRVSRAPGTRARRTIRRIHEPYRTRKQ